MYSRKQRQQGCAHAGARARLQEDVEDIGVRFLHLIKEHHRVGAPPARGPGHKSKAMQPAAREHAAFPPWWVFRHLVK
jgi:hypothetical protein